MSKTTSVSISRAALNDLHELRLVLSRSRDDEPVTLEEALRFAVEAGLRERKAVLG